MAIHVHNLSKKNFGQNSVTSLSHLSVSCPSWWNSNEQQIPLSLSKNVSLKVESPTQLYQDAKHLGLQLPDQESSFAQSIGQSHHEPGVMGRTNSQSNSSEPGEDESCEKGIEGQMKPVILFSNLDTVFSPSQVNNNHSMACTRYPYADAYFGGLCTPHGQQVLIQAQMGQQMVGTAPTRIPLPFDFAEDGPIYVNAKQYHGILRRRQSRAKLEAQNKLVKSRKPYLHESRHRHAVSRVRGSGGRFLSTKKLQHPDSTTTKGVAHYIPEPICLQQKNNITEFESRCSGTAEYGGSSTTCSDITSVSTGDAIFRQAEHKFPGISPHLDGDTQSGGSVMWNGARHCASIVQ